MHTHSLEPWTHQHVFLGERHERHGRRTLAVVALTALATIAEIGGGTLFGSLALVADGWHMSTHVAALGIAALAYRFARRHAGDRRFSFGTGKVGDLAAFASAMVLGAVAVLIGADSIERLIHPVAIRFGEAIPIAFVGLAVNIASVALLHDGAHDHGHGQGHGHDHGHGHRHDHATDDTNFRAAYLHVLADTLTAVLAIAALFGARFLRWNWLDPAAGLIGTVVILSWGVSLLRSAGAVLLDVVPADGMVGDCRSRLETDGDLVADVHLWRIGPGHRAAVLSVVTDHPRDPGFYKAKLADLPALSHVTVEVLRCPDHAAAA